MLSTTLQTLRKQYAQLLALLNEEREALTGIDTEGLRSAVEAKQQLLSAIHDASQSLGPVRVSEQIAAAPEAQRNDLEALAASLKQLAMEAHEANRINGKIVARSQKSVRELMTVLHGQPSEAIYGEHGEPKHLNAGASVAQA